MKQLFYLENIHRNDRFALTSKKSFFQHHSRTIKTAGLVQREENT